MTPASKALLELLLDLILAAVVLLAGAPWWAALIVFLALRSLARARDIAVSMRNLALALDAAVALAEATPFSEAEQLH